jgi:YD repeat-containing protein
MGMGSMQVSGFCIRQGFGRQADRLKRSTFPDTTYEELSYGAMGNVTAKLTRGGQLIQNIYDALDSMVSHLNSGDR